MTKNSLIREEIHSAYKEKVRYQGQDVPFNGQKSLYVLSQFMPEMEECVALYFRVMGLI